MHSSMSRELLTIKTHKTLDVMQVDCCDCMHPNNVTGATHPEDLAQFLDAGCQEIQAIMRVQDSAEMQQYAMKRNVTGHLWIQAQTLHRCYGDEELQATAWMQQHEKEVQATEAQVAEWNYGSKDCGITIGIGREEISKVVWRQEQKWNERDEENSRGNKSEVTVPRQRKFDLETWIRRPV